MKRNVIYYGRPEDQPEPIPLRAGPFELVYQAGDLRYIRLGAHEVVRRIYLAARDGSWGTAPNVIERHSVEMGSRGFVIRHIASSRLGDVALAWQAEITGAPDGAITYRIKGRAERAFETNRVGLCLLHPATVAGARCRVTHSDGSVEEGRFPERIAPHQPFTDVAAIAHEVAAGVWATVTLEGDIFEMEDQRNWTDASFKTYSRPLALPYPFEVYSGQRFEQAFTLHIEGAAAVAATAPEPTGALWASVAPVGAATLPAIGSEVSDDGSLDEAAAARLAALAPGHLRVALQPETDAATLTRWAQTARALPAPLELALIDGGRSTTTRAVDWIARERLDVARVLLCTVAGDSASDLLAHAARALAGRVDKAALWVGTNRYFTNLNRERPAAVGAAGVFYSLNPQVHAFDDASLVETLPTQAETVRSAQALYPGLPVAVTPITLRPRTAAAPDPRQPSLLAAGWTLGSIASLALAGASALTYYELLGPRGLLAGDGAPYPVYHLLRWLAGWRGARVHAIELSDPLQLQGLALRRKGEQRVILANLTGRAQRLRVSGLSVDGRVRWLDERCVVDGQWHDPAAATPLPAAGGRAEIELLPYGLVCIDD